MDYLNNTILRHVNLNVLVQNTREYTKFVNKTVAGLKPVLITEVNWPLEIMLVDDIFDGIPYFNIQPPNSRQGGINFRPSAVDNIEHTIGQLVKRYIYFNPRQPSDGLNEYRQKATQHVLSRVRETVTYIKGQAGDELTQILQKATQTLTQRRQQVINLLYYSKEGQGMNILEVATELEVHVSSIWDAKRRALPILEKSHGDEIRLYLETKANDAIEILPDADIIINKNI